MFRFDLFTGLIFLLSGVPALIYQLAWQRVLFTLYGVNIESITVIVTAFMIGLGLGSVVGGQLSKRLRRSALAAFGVIELAIGTFGYFSLEIFNAVGQLTWSVGTLATLVVSFGLVVIPTTLMGATLPLLVSLRVALTGNVGQSVGIFYFVNTLGAAIACFLAVGILFVYVGLSGAVAFSVCFNVLLAVTAFTAHFLWSKRICDAMLDTKAENGIEQVKPNTGERSGTFYLAMLLVAFAGFISISYEIVWARLYGFASAGNPLSFGAMLGFYLLGIALGSFFSRAFCGTIRSAGSSRNLIILAGFVLISVGSGFAVPAIVAHVLQNGMNWIYSLPIVTFAAALWGSLLPILSHFAIRPDEKAGEGFSWLYLSNILGSACGGLITGFVLLDILSFGQVNLMLAFAGLLIVGILISRANLGKPSLVTCFGTTVLLGAVLFGLKPALYSDLYGKLYYNKNYTAPSSKDGSFARTIETKSGVITVSDDGVVAGGGAYDGKFNVDFVNDTNGIKRPYSISLFRSSPRNALIIGLGSGSWSQVIAHLPTIESITIVEINKGYLEVVGGHSIVRSLIKNPKVQIIVDDGRRYLSRHPEKRFDLVVMNTTFHWRAYVSNLLSTEFFGMVRDHLTDDGLLVFNTTGSAAAEKTALGVFRHGALLGQNAMFVSKAPLLPDERNLAATLSKYKIDGSIVLSGDTAARERKAADIARRIATLFVPGSVVRNLTKSACIVTDNNMCTEYRIVARSYFPSLFSAIDNLVAIFE